MSSLELGQATIVYDDPEDGTVELTVDQESTVYVRDHWTVKTGTDDDGNDLVRQIPRERVYYVDRDVERFEDYASTLRSRVESMARDIRERLPVDVGEAGGRPRDEPPAESTKIHIEEPDE